MTATDLSMVTLACNLAKKQRLTDRGLPSKDNVTVHLILQNQKRALRWGDSSISQMPWETGKERGAL